MFCSVTRLRLNTITLLSDLNSRDIDVVVLPDGLVAVRRFDGVLPYAEGGWNFGLRCVFPAITNAKALVSNVEDDSTDLVCRKIETFSTIVNKLSMFFWKKNTDRVARTSTVDTTTHSI